MTYNAKLLILSDWKSKFLSPTIELFKKSGWRISISSRNYFPDVDDDTLSCTLIRAQEMSRHVVDGTLDLGLTGKDWFRENGSEVVVVQDLMETNTQLISNRKSWEDPWKREKIEQISLLLQGALKADGLVGLKMNIPKETLDEIIKLLPSFNAPTVSNLYQKDWFSVETVISEFTVRELMPKLIKSGAEGIIEYSLNKVI